MSLQKSTYSSRAGIREAPLVPTRDHTRRQSSRRDRAKRCLQHLARVDDNARVDAQLVLKPIEYVRACIRNFLPCEVHGCNSLEWREPTKPLRR